MKIIKKDWESKQKINIKTYKKKEKKKNTKKTDIIVWVKEPKIKRISKKIIVRQKKYQYNHDLIVYSNKWNSFLIMIY